MPKGEARGINNKDKVMDGTRRRWRAKGSPMGPEDNQRMLRDSDALGRGDFKTKGTGLKAKADRPESYNSGNAPSSSSGRRRPGDDRPKSNRKRPGK